MHRAPTTIAPKEQRITFTQRGLIGSFYLALLILSSASASSGVNRFDATPSSVTIPVRVTNESGEPVHLWFLSETGHRVRIGTVQPYSTAEFSSVLGTSLSGRLIVRRLSNDAATPMTGELEPYFLANRTVAVRIGPEAAFDFWQVR